jgi:hypothetical protein
MIIEDVDRWLGVRPNVIRRAAGGSLTAEPRFPETRLTEPIEA